MQKHFPILLLLCSRSINSELKPWAACHARSIFSWRLMKSVVCSVCTYLCFSIKLRFKYHHPHHLHPSWALSPSLCKQLNWDSFIQSLKPPYEVGIIIINPILEMGWVRHTVTYMYFANSAECPLPANLAHSGVRKLLLRAVHTFLFSWAHDCVVSPCLWGYKWPRDLLSPMQCEWRRQGALLRESHYAWVCGRPHSHSLRWQSATFHLVSAPWAWTWVKSMWREDPMTLMGMEK